MNEDNATPDEEPTETTPPAIGESPSPEVAEMLKDQKPKGKQVKLKRLPDLDESAAPGKQEPSTYRFHGFDLLSTCENGHYVETEIRIRKPDTKVYQAMACEHCKFKAQAELLDFPTLDEMLEMRKAEKAAIRAAKAKAAKLAGEAKA